MKRLADEECPETQSTAKKIRTDRSADFGSAVSTSLLTSNALQPKDGIIEEVHLVNFMTFNSHRFRFGLSYSDFNLSLDM